MENVKSDVSIENENLFRALVCAPVAILLAILTASSVSGSGFTLVNIILVLVTAYFALCAVAYAAFYTNEFVSEKPDNDNLLNAISYGTVAIIIGGFTIGTVLSTGNIFFQVIFVCLSLYLALNALAYAAYYTNDCADDGGH